MASAVFKDEIHEFYVNQLEGKTTDELGFIIRSLKVKIGQMKGVMECPEHNEPLKEMISTNLYKHQLYLEEAKRTFEELGGKYILTSGEVQAAKFNRHVPHIARIEARTGNEKYGYIHYYFDLSEETITAEYSHHGPIDKWPHKIRLADNKNEFLQKLKDLHIGTWKKRYSLKQYNPNKYGEIPWYKEDDWFVTFYYNNRKLPVTIEGNCVYPYNFEAFRKLMNFYPIDAPKEVRLAQMKKDQQRRVEKIAV